MLPVSTDYHEAIRKDNRLLRAKLEITWTDPYIDQSIQVTTNDQARISWPKQTADGLENPARKYLSVDGTCKPDGSYYPCPDTEELARTHQMGYWSQSLSRLDCTFPDPHPQLTTRFLPRPIWGLKVVGDSERGEWPVDFAIHIYNQSGLIHTETVTDNQVIFWQAGISGGTINDANRMALEIIKWSHPGRNAKILEFFTSVSEFYEGDDIALVDLIEEREISEGSLPIGNITANEIDIRLINAGDRFNPSNTRSPIANQIRPNRKIKAWLGPVLPSGIVEYQPLGVFWTRGWNIPETSLYADTTARDRMEMLKEVTYRGPVLRNATLYACTVAVMEYAKITLADLEYWVDPALQEETIPWFGLDNISCREALTIIAARALGQAYADRFGITRLEGEGFIKIPEEE